MKEQKLVSMIDFVLERKEYHRLRCYNNYQSETHCRADHSRECENYANFLKQPLTLGMFVACSDGDEPLPEPKEYEHFLKYGDFGTLTGAKLRNCKRYQQAKERCIFEGCSISFNTISKQYWLRSHHNTTNTSIGVGESISELLPSVHYATVEDLIHLEPTLTPTACKQIGYDN